MRRIDYIIFHCSATKEGKHFTAQDIDLWHRQRGFRCIGYHYVVLLDGTIETGRLEREVGAHAAGFNVRSISVVYIGGLGINGEAKDTRTNAQKESSKKLITKLKKKYPFALVLGHRDLPKVTKQCPCFDAKEEYKS